MSNCELKKPATPSKLLSGGGDGIHSAKLRLLQNQQQRVPVPSCRRFATHWGARDAAVKQKLERAIREMESPKKPTTTSIPRGLRRSISMSEITPARRQYNAKMCRLDEHTPRHHHQQQHQKGDDEDAGRRVYAQLLLNAWRHRRKEAKGLVEMCQKLQEEVEQLKLQKDVLQKLRESESRRRSEAATESVLLRERIEKQQEEIEKLYEERETLLKNVEELEDDADDLKMQVENSRNNWLATKGEMKALEQQLVKERGKMRRLANDKHDLQEKLSKYELCVCKKTEELAQAKTTLRDAETNIENLIVTNRNKEEEILILGLQLQDEKEANAQLAGQMKENERNVRNLEQKIFELRGKLCDANDVNRKLREGNEELSRDLQTAKIVVEEMQSRPWYKNAGELAKSSLVALQYAAFLMLPALPQHLGKK